MCIFKYYWLQQVRYQDVVYAAVSGNDDVYFIWAIPPHYKHVYPFLKMELNSQTTG